MTDQARGRRRAVPRGVVLAVVVLFVTSWVPAGAALLIATHEIHQEQAGQRAAQQAQQHAARREQAAQLAAGLKLERQLCATFGKAAALRPPAGNPVRNPSRAYLQGQHAIWLEVLGDLKCPG